MTPRIFLAAGAAAGLIAAALPASAALGISIVKDPWNVAQTTATVRALADQYRTMVEQLAAAKAEVAALTSHSGQGRLFDGPAERAARRYLPDAWTAATEIQRTAHAADGAHEGTSAAIGRATAVYTLATSAEIDPGGQAPLEVAQYEREAGTALAVLGASEVMLDRSADRRDTYEGLMARIEAAPDAKAAADLSNRLMAENGLTQNELVRATAMQANMLAFQEMRLAAARAASARAAVRTRVNLSGGTYAPAS